MHSVAPSPGLGRGLACAIAGLLAVGAARAAEGDAKEAAAPFVPRGLIELKRQATERGTPDETTKTQLKFDFFVDSGPVALLRLELPFPDARTDFAGSPFNPDRGDAKVRIGFAAVDLAGHPTTSFAEFTFPTADPPSQGKGKYQLSLGAKMAFKLPAPPAWTGAVQQALSVQLEQVASYAGDPARGNINQTKIEVEWRDTWPGGHSAKATLKPVVDWIGNGRTGAVLELEGVRVVGQHWSFALMGGGLLWGEGVPSTYRKRVELKLIYRY